MKAKLIANSIAACGLLAALAIALAAPVSAQTLTRKFSVPFDFVVRGRTMPAGDYVVGPVSSLNSALLAVLAVQSKSTGTGELTVTSPAPAVPSQDRAKALLIFHRYGGEYFLAGLWDGDMAIGRLIPMSKAERERAKTASLGKSEVVTLLARL
jgi:hypothetical protein